MIYAVSAAFVAGGVYYTLNPRADKVENAAKEGAAEEVKDKAQGVTGKAAFTGGDQGFISLKLASVENVNHNTKKFRFEFPEGDQVSGLETASCVYTKYKSPDMEKAVLRPYTPVSDTGMV